MVEGRVAALKRRCTGPTFTSRADSPAPHDQGAALEGERATQSHLRIVQIDAQGEQVGAEEAHGGGVRGTPRALAGEPALAFARVVLGQLVAVRA